MNPGDDPQIEGFARRIKRAWSGSAYRKLRDEVRAQPDGGVALLRALANNKSEVVRVWAGGVARKELGRHALPILYDLAQHPRLQTRDAAMQEIEAIDPELLRPFVPEMRRIFRRSKELYSPGGAAMWRLARLGDDESAAYFRRYAASRDPAWYDHRMPMVLADYIEDPTSVVRRLRAHDHEWTLWLARAACVLDPPGADEALRVGGEGAPDPECRQICAQQLRALLERRLAPHPHWDHES